MSTVWRAEKGPEVFIAAVCSYVPVSWSKSSRVVKLYLGPASPPTKAGGHGAPPRGGGPGGQRGALEGG